jgi:hypothetical protein
LLVASLVLGASRAAVCAPRAVLETPTVSLGEVVAGERARPVVTVRNEGDAPLALAVTARGPATVRAPATIAAGETGRIEVEVDTVALSGPSVVPIHLRTDDPAARDLEVAIRLEVRHFVVATPGHARYVFVRGEAPVTVVQRLRALDGRAFRIRDTRSPAPALRATPQPHASGPTHTLGLTLESDAAVGALEGGVEVLLDHPRQQRLVIPVSGFVRPVLAVTPTALTPAPARGPWQARLHVRSFAEAPLELRRATSDVPGLDLRVEPLESGRTWVVRVQGTDAGSAGTVRLETSSPVQPVVEVAIRRAER